MKFGLLDRKKVKVGDYYLGLDLNMVWDEIGKGKRQYDAKIAALVLATITKVVHERFYWEDKTVTPPRTGYVDFPINNHPSGNPESDIARICDIPGVVLTQAPDGEIQRLVSLPFLDDLIDSVLTRKGSVEVTLS